MDENHDGLTQGVLIMWWFNRRKEEQVTILLNHLLVQH